MEQSKTCGICHTAKPLEAFGKDNSTPDGKHRYCKDCLHQRQNDARRRRKLLAAEKQNAQKPRSRQQKAGELKTTVVLEFSDHPALLNAIILAARHEFRSVPQQILYLIATSVQAGAEAHEER